MSTTMNMPRPSPTLPTLPTELVEIIVKKIPSFNDRLRFRLVCKELDGKSFRIWTSCFKSVRTNLSRASLSGLHKLLEPSPELSRRVDNLTIRKVEKDRGKGVLGFGFDWRRSAGITDPYHISDETPGFQLLRAVLSR
ncbi:hypothetical protein BT63DRAFT_171805 [Microthyrium microscopicum]|uniref:F-box domain-containing protein n=1 Tax=Microthyrium microscopicum TaxID=703497 RepID=A0A6A6UNT6_9PEZI|nr:hypothetical protein BT63DRAFT_171805 [Microthyrium microscopicum]